MKEEEAAHSTTVPPTRKAEVLGREGRKGGREGGRGREEGRGESAWRVNIRAA